MARRIPAARPAGPAFSHGDGGPRFVAFSHPMPTDSFERARALQQAGDFAGAARLYADAADADPSHFRALHNLGVVLEAQGDAAGAGSAYERSLAANPDSAWTHYNLARLRHLGGDAAAAERGYRRALALDD
jgi:tetratricopeptide (TPR) repeat protein